MEQFLVQLAIKPEDDLMQAQVKAALPALFRTLRAFCREHRLLLEIQESHGPRPSRLAQCAVRTSRKSWFVSRPAEFVFLLNLGLRKHTLTPPGDSPQRAYESSPLTLHVYPRGAEPYRLAYERLPTAKWVGKWFAKELKTHYARWQQRSAGR